MKKYYSIDGNPKMQITGMLVAMLVPIFGCWWFGTKFTSMYSGSRILGGLWVIMMALCHIGILTYLILA